MKTYEPYGLAELIAEKLQSELSPLPEGFLDSFNFTKTGNNFSHPIVWGLLTRIVWGLEGVKSVGIDVRFNKKGAKFQPDIVAFDESCGPFRPLFFIDYESPNSSDARILVKDVDAYSKWRAGQSAAAPYLIVTTLPDAACEWELRYCSKGSYNEEFKGNLATIKSGPSKFWYEHYYDQFRGRDMTGICMVNICGNTARRTWPRGSLCSHARPV